MTKICSAQAGQNQAPIENPPDDFGNSLHVWSKTDMEQFLQQQSNKLQIRCEMLLFALIVPTTLALSDNYLLRACQTSNDPSLLLWLTYAWFCTQTAAVAVWVGKRLHTSPWWWGMLAWTVLLIDLQVFIIATPISPISLATKSLGYAFVSAQVGMVVVWALLGGGLWQQRLPLCVAGFVWALFLGFSMEFGEMALLVLGQSAAISGFCLIMRSANFRLTAASEAITIAHGDGFQPAQFSLRHLFYWTTAVALLSGTGRLIDWGVVFAFLPRESVPGLVWDTIALTGVSVVGTWMALGGETWLTRWLLGMLLLSIAGLGIGLGHAILPMRLGPSLWEARANMSEGMWGASAWTVLAGLFLTCLLFVFRARGERLYHLKLRL